VNYRGVEWAPWQPRGDIAVAIEKGYAKGALEVVEAEINRVLEHLAKRPSVYVSNDVELLQKFELRGYLLEAMKY
jgi:hypothetical protein